MFDRFPWKTHRTMAEVEETNQLYLMSIRGWKWGEGGKARRLHELLDKEEANNPPPYILPEDAA